MATFFKNFTAAEIAAFFTSPRHWEFLSHAEEEEGLNALLEEWDALDEQFEYLINELDWQREIIKESKYPEEAKEEARISLIQLYLEKEEVLEETAKIEEQVHECELRIMNKYYSEK